MRGYRDQPERSAAVLRDGWYATGDMGHLDTDGFLTITGRLSRFSKLGGEMISHGLIESALQAALDLEPEALAVIAVTDAKHGERLCVTHTRPLSSKQIQDCLQKLELPNLWKPAPGNWLFLEKIPLLGSGKIDYRALKLLAETIKS